MVCFSPLVLGFSHDARWLARTDWMLAIISHFQWIVRICAENGKGGPGRKEKERGMAEGSKKERMRMRKKEVALCAKFIQGLEHVDAGWGQETLS